MYAVARFDVHAHCQILAEGQIIGALHATCYLHTLMTCAAGCRVANMLTAALKRIIHSFSKTRKSCDERLAIG